MYNENGVRIILKYSESNEQDKNKRYKALFALPSFIVLLLLLSEDFNYIFMSFVVVAFILIELIIFGIMDTIYHYSLSDFLKDGFYLIVSSIIITYLAAPIIMSLITRYMTLSHTILNGLKFFLSLLLLYGTWFSIVTMQSKLRRKSEMWKWEVIGFFNSGKEKNEEI
ncbi:hypothetical protein SAMN04488102_105127 [Alkalibacterium subtropicum]|uniref:Uncharacterized protein n=1 Tax=Alkalibacterium subtropicum TaxID=753702 RepID=A0A1I1IK11_9LACT|nr:hypothetical protein SAMN04488102_105127 [Alkalibacterium subtropicum]